MIDEEHKNVELVWSEIKRRTVEGHGPVGNMHPEIAGLNYLSKGEVVLRGLRLFVEKSS
jgi:hypothetical protein